MGDDERYDAVVLGGGPAGLAAAWYAARAGRRVALIERADHVGGLAGSFEVAGVRVDHGSHRLHERTEPDLLADLQGLLGDELQHRPRDGRIRLCERWVAFPLQAGDLVTRGAAGVRARVPPATSPPARCGCGAARTPSPRVPGPVSGRRSPARSTSRTPASCSASTPPSSARSCSADASAPARAAGSCAGCCHATRRPGSGTRPAASVASPRRSPTRPSRPAPCCAPASPPSPSGPIRTGRPSSCPTAPRCGPAGSCRRCRRA